MVGNKLMVLVSKMSGVEKRAFTKFLASVYHNNRPELTAYWQLLLKETVSDGFKFSSEAIYERLFPALPFDLVHFRHLNSWLLKKIEQFFMLRKSEGRDFENQLALAITYREKKLEPLFKKHLNIARKGILSQKLDPERFLAAYRVEFEQYAFIESEKRTGSTNLQGLNDSLDQYLLISKLKQSCLMLAHQAVYKIDYDFTFLDALLKFLEGHELLKNPALALYYHCYRAFNENDSNHFYAFKELMTKYQDDFSPRELRGLLLFALNFLIRQMNEGDQSYAREAWDFYLLGINQKLLYENDYLGRFTYKNIVALAIKLKEFVWTEEFIQEYKTALPPKYQENYANYNQAQLHFAQGEYQLAMPLLASLDDSDILLNFDAKVVLLKMYFELGEMDALFSLLDSFTLMLQRKKVVGYHRSYYKELVKFTKRLLELPVGPSALRNRLEKEILAKDKFPEKNWFLRMVAHSGN